MGIRSRSDARGIALHELDDELVIVSAPLGGAPAPLAKAELEVARLAAFGRTNAEIAAERDCSVHTVANQIASAMKKLGAASRVALAAKLAKMS